MSDFVYHICGKAFIGCPGDVDHHATQLCAWWDDLPVSGVKPEIYYWRKDYDPFAHSASVGGQYRIERTANPSVNPVFILFGQTIGTPVRPPPEGWQAMRTWLDDNGWGFIALFPEPGFDDPDRPPKGKIPLSGTMYELFDALRTGDDTNLILYDLSQMLETPDAETVEYRRQRGWRKRLLRELGKNHTIRRPESDADFHRTAIADLKRAFNLPTLDPLYDELPSLAAVGVDEPLLFGRGALITLLSNSILTERTIFTRVVGVSGAGKSSLLRSGLMGSWFNRTRGSAGLHAKVTALLVEPALLQALEPDPLLALTRLLTGFYGDRATGAVGPSPRPIKVEAAAPAEPTGDRRTDLAAALHWWKTIEAGLDGPLVLILDQAEQIDRQARREANERVERDRSADPTPRLSPEWQRFVDLMSSLAGVGGMDVDADHDIAADKARFRLILGLHRLEAIALWDCDGAKMDAASTVKVAPFRDEWKAVIRGTVVAYGLTIDPALLKAMADQACALADERQPVHVDPDVNDDVSHDAASILPLVKVALQRLLLFWRALSAQRGDDALSDADRHLDAARFIQVADIANSIEMLGELAIDFWKDNLSKGAKQLGLFERAALEREIDRRFDHLFMGLIDVGDSGNPELGYISRTGTLASDEEDLIDALHSARLLTGPDAGHWRLPHRTLISFWKRGAAFISRYEKLLAAKQRLKLHYKLDNASDQWPADQIDSFVTLALGWIGNDEGDDSTLHDYLRSGLTARFDPAAMGIGGPGRLPSLPFAVLQADHHDWVHQLLARSMAHADWHELAGFWVLIFANAGDHRNLDRVLSSLNTQDRGSAANYVEPNSGVSPLLMAAENGHPYCVQSLLAAGADPDRINPVNTSFPLIMAAQNGHEQCLDLLIKAGANPEQHDLRDGGGPLLIAAQEGHSGCVGMLLAAGANPDHIAPSNGIFPLLVAAQSGHALCVQMLLDADASPNQEDPQDGGFPLLMAAQGGHDACIELLLAKGADPNQVNKMSGNLPLLAASQNGHAGCVQMLLAAKAQPNQPNQRNGAFPLLMAAQNGHHDCVKLLLDRRAAPCQIDQMDGGFPILMAAQNGHAACVELLLGAGAQADQIDKIDGGFALLMAAQNGHGDCVKLLIDAGASPNRANVTNGCYPLLMAAQEGHDSCIELLLAAGAKANQSSRMTGSFPLLAASQDGHDESVRMLLDAGARPNRRNKVSGTFALVMAAQEGRVDSVRLLLAAGAEPNWINRENGTFPLLLAAQNGHELCVQLLLAAGAQPNQSNPLTGTFPLLAATKNGHGACVGLLLRAGAQPDKQGKKHLLFPLLFAAETGQVDCLEMLLAAGAKPGKVHKPSGIFPLLLASQSGRDACIGPLIAAGAKVNQTNPVNGVFPLLVAAQQNHVTCVETLLALGADPLQRHEQDDVSALNIALMSRSLSTVHLLVKIPGMLDTVPENARELANAIAALDEEEISELERNASQQNDAPQAPAKMTPLPIPVFLGSALNLTGKDLEKAITIFLDLLHAAPGTAISEEVSTISLNVHGDRILFSRVRFPSFEADLMACDLPSFDQRFVLGPGLNIGDLAISLENRKRPLLLNNEDRAKFWISLLLVFSEAFPIQESAPWPPVEYESLPSTVYREEYWRRWIFAYLPQGPTLTLPYIHEGKLLRGRFLIPADGVGIGLLAPPEVIMSGLDMKLSRFWQTLEDGPAMWIFQEIEHE